MFLFLPLRFLSPAFSPFLRFFSPAFATALLFCSVLPTLFISFSPRGLVGLLCGSLAFCVMSRYITLCSSHLRLTLSFCLPYYLENVFTDTCLGLLAFSPSFCVRHLGYAFFGSSLAPFLVRVCSAPPVFFSVFFPVSFLFVHLF